MQVTMQLDDRTERSKNKKKHYTRQVSDVLRNDRVWLCSAVGERAKSLVVKEVILRVSSTTVSGSGGFSGRVFSCTVPVVASGSVHAGDPSGGPVVSARIGLGLGSFCPKGGRHAEDPSGIGGVTPDGWRGYDCHSPVRPVGDLGALEALSML